MCDSGINITIEQEESYMCAQEESAVFKLIFCKKIVIYNIHKYCETELHRRAQCKNCRVPFVTARH